MRTTQALLAASALVSSVSANCFWYNARRYGLEHPDLPGVAATLAINSEGNSETYCYGEITYEMAEEVIGTYTIDCPADGWFVTLQPDLSMFRITTPDSDAAGENIDVTLDWDSNDLGNGIGFLLSVDGKNGC